MVTSFVTSEKSGSVQTVHGSGLEFRVIEETYCFNSAGDSAGASTFSCSCNKDRVLEICCVVGIASCRIPWSEKSSRAADGANPERAASLRSCFFCRLSYYSLNCELQCSPFVSSTINVSEYVQNGYENSMVASSIFLKVYRIANGQCWPASTSQARQLA